MLPLATGRRSLCSWQPATVTRARGFFSKIISSMLATPSAANRAVSHWQPQPLQPPQLLPPQPQLQQHRNGGGSGKGRAAARRESEIFCIADLTAPARPAAPTANRRSGCTSRAPNLLPTCGGRHDTAAISDRQHRRAHVDCSPHPLLLPSLVVGVTAGSDQYGSFPVSQLKSVTPRAQTSTAILCPPGLKIRTPAHTKHPGWCLEFEFRVTHPSKESSVPDATLQCIGSSHGMLR